MHETLAPNDYGEGDVSLRSYKCEVDPTLAPPPCKRPMSCCMKAYLNLDLLLIKSRLPRRVGNTLF